MHAATNWENTFVKPDGPVTIERVLQICVAALAALGAVLLGIGERTSLMALLACYVSASSVYLTDFKGWLRLSQSQANLLAGGGVLWAAWSIGGQDISSWLLPVANLCTWLQFILQYQRKYERHYWMLIVLSLLQAAVATALSYDLIFGAAMLAYLPVGVTTLLLFFLYREMRRHTRADQPLESPDVPAEPVFDDELRLSIVLRHVGVVCVTTLILTATAFLAVPRLGRASWQAGTPIAQRMVGMSEDVSLGQAGFVNENPEAVMRVSFFDEATGEPYAVTDSLLFRGLHFARYEKGDWHQGPKGRVDRLDVRPGPEGAVLQEITIEPLQSEVLFSIHPFIKHETNDELLYNRRRQQLMRSDSRTSTQFRYNLLTTGLHDGRQYAFVPCLDPADDRQLFAELPQAELFPHLIELARDLVADLPADDHYARARRLESHLRYSGDFTYSLNLMREDPSIDPLEDFLVNTQQGHCQYFASALTLMLRSVGIPARLVVGFKGGEWNHLGHFYQVRQLHAHAWVEAYMPPEMLPDDRPPSSDGWQRGGWLLLDPTPGVGRQLANASIGFNFMALRQAIDYLRYLWSGFIVGMDASRQFELFYRPLGERVVAFFRGLFDPAQWRVWIADWMGALRRGDVGWFGTTWRLALLLAIILGLGQLVWLGLRRMARGRWWRHWAAVLRGDESASSIEFYRRLESLLADHGLIRLPQQTQQEFALAVGSLLSDRSATRGVATVPLRVTEVFYRVRFGGRDLDKTESEVVEQSLFDLKAALSAPSA